MLRVKHICKSYETGKLVQKALDDVSLELRDNEFVAILGPSGSGKTTLLNIIGGLDQYDSGDLVINGISTKEYNDRDWDSYRNHSVGFVFQSYNLIPHQSILSNVELALTISGEARSERRKRAKEALEKVGLKDQMHKLPEQLSGGQMQRVAIARALVNDPEILLADEPTGALDSETSIQVMDLLQEVAKERLVVMVTHNPELADRYATRIIKLSDGRIRSDTDPVSDDAGLPEEVSHKNMGKASMSFLTALSLSFRNLSTKKARTFLTAFAGSIGIIGIALILSASAGVNKYIAEEEEAMLYAYPLEIQDTSFDMTSLFGGTFSDQNPDDGQIGVLETMTKLFSSIGENDLGALRDYFESDECDIYDYVNAIEYTYDIEPQIYYEEDGTYRQVNPNTILSDVNTGILSADASPISSLFEADVFFQLPENDSVYNDQYEIVSGRWPESYNECVVVLDSDGNISDTMMYILGLRDSYELDDMVEQFLDGKDVDIPEDFGRYDTGDIIGTEYKLVSAADYYEYDSEYDVWVDKTDDRDYLQELAADGETLEVVGIVRPISDSGQLLDAGIYYTPELIRHIMENAADSQIVQDQIARPDVNVFTGEEFGVEADEAETDLSSLFQIDSDAVADAFDFDEDDIEESLAGSVDLSDFLDSASGISDISGSMDLGNITFSIPDLSIYEASLGDITDNLEITISADGAASLAASLLSGYQSCTAGNPRADYTLLPDGFASYLQSEEARGILSDNISEIIVAEGDITLTADQISELGTSLMSGFQEYITSEGYTDGGLFAEYFAEYMTTQAARDVVNEWAAENLQISPDFTITSEQAENLISELTDGYEAYASENSLPTAESISESFQEYLESDYAQNILTQGFLEMIDTESIESQVESAIGGYMQQIMNTYGTALSDTIQSEMTSAVNSVMNQIAGQFGDSLETMMSEAAGTIGDSIAGAVELDADALLDAFGLNMDVTQLTDLLSSLTSADTASYSDNLAALGYAEEDDLGSIIIYPADFESKEAVIDILDQYNQQMEETGQEDRVISYSDTTGTLMSSITDMTNIVSVVMIAVVAVSLVVSSIMIGVITYISVLERKKEIGILRALGASKGNISAVFNAETVIIGLFSGCMGIIAAYLLIIPVNRVIHSYLNMDTISIFLPPSYAAVLVAISVGLTLFSGLIPSLRAAKSDPVEALRTE